MKMNDPSQYLSTLNCEVSIVRAKNMEFFNKTSSGGFFVRCYISAGNDERVQLNTTEIPSSSSSSFYDDLFWNESFSLKCLGTESSINSLRQGNVVFELRWRCSSGSFIGRIGGSKLLGRAEIPWKSVFESEKMEIETWAHMISKSPKDVKPPKVQVRMKVGAEKIIAKRRQEQESCGCRKGCGCKCLDYVDYDISALGI